MRVKIYICEFDAPLRTIQTEIFQSMVSGRPPQGEYISDVNGVNLADMNELSELRHQFFVWKNLLSNLDYVGFEHYRRLLFVDPTSDRGEVEKDNLLLQVRGRLMSNHQRIYPMSTQEFDAYWNYRRSFTIDETERVKNWIGSADVITVRPDNVSVEETWKKHHDHEQWPIIVQAIRAAPYFQKQTCLIDFGCSRGYYNNIYIMRSDLFSEYMQFFFDIVALLRDTLPKQQFRMFGYVAERIFSFWLNQKRIETPLLRVLELPLLFHQPETQHQ